ncbi:outer envelope pore protein 16, chloroplastic isoform X1 [Cryptomeria japonica]|uniref:outer envelope pore protein 16, chloroplastic isoform X1 n=1 Tax=Cryptomeria japonica TaxID=3369 RepID=UPI0027D9E429|nr:outer envelope pore protein 16, chloroplastic isoform X1 [Cryptomeria japonica]XP_059077391.1 outer envelope pore protein 16, chloroplastic isoform X1 [Cryptomeria japonica]XP_059077392.1 outer envelope pore protein 16, chloroplastic isoform X1 [Cryptomeria japonica]
MPYGTVSANVKSPTLGVFVDLGNPLLNRTVDGFMTIGTVGASRVIAEETYDALRKGSITKQTLEHAVSILLRYMELYLLAAVKNVKKMGKEGLQWGALGGVYIGMEYGMERVRGKRDWKNALIGGALTGGLATLGENHSSKDKIITNAIMGGAIATASEFIRYLT